MLELTIQRGELWDEQNEVFIPIPPVTLRLEHSLISLSKWESKWKKPFLKTFEKIEQVKTDEWLDYIRCMTVNPNVPADAYLALTQDQMRVIHAYMNDPMTATWFSDKNKKKPQSRQIVTAEIIYFKMTYLGIPFECEKWHLNRLTTLIRVCEEKSAPPKKMGQKEAAIDNARLNAMRRKSLRSRG